MSLFGKASEASLWQAINIACQVPTQFVVLATLSHFLTPAEFGLVAVVNIVLTFVVAITQGAIRPAVIQKETLTFEDISTAFFCSLIIGVSFSILIFFSAPISANFFESEQLIRLQQAYAAIFLINSFVSVSEGLADREFNFKLVAIATIFAQLVGYGLVSITLAFYGFGVWSLFYGALAQALIRALILYLGVAHSLRISWNNESFRFFSRFGLGVSLASIMNFMAINADKVIVSKMLGNAALGLYNLAFTIMDMPRKFLSSIVEKVAYPVFSRKASGDDELLETYQLVSELVILLLLIITILAVSITPYVIRVFWAESWWECILLTQIMLLQIPIRSYVRLSDNLLTAKGILLQNAKIKLVYLSLLVVGAYFGSEYGIEGVAMGVTVAVLINSAMSFFLVTKHLNDYDLKKLILAFSPGIKVSLILILIAGLTTNAVAYFGGGDAYKLLCLLLVFLVTLLCFLFLAPRILGEAFKWLLFRLTNTYAGNKYPGEWILVSVKQKLVSE